jgi:hypothetical protein
MTELINDVFNRFYSKIRQEAALLHVQMLELNGTTISSQTNCCAPTNECNMDTLKDLEGRVMEIVKGLEMRLETSFKHRFELIEKTIATLMESASSDDEHAQVAPEPEPEPAPAPVKVATLKQALPIPTKEVSPIHSANVSPVVSEEEDAEEVEDNESVVAEEEETAVEETAVEEEEEEEEAAEEEENELTEFQFRGKTYYLDNENNVYGLDTDGELIQEPVGVRDEKTGRIKFTVSV